MMNQLRCLAVLGLTVLSNPVTPARAAALYPVVVGGRWGYIDKSGNMVINPQFEKAGAFAFGMAEVRLGRWGYVDGLGKIVINPQFDEATPFSDGLAVVEFGHRYGFVD